MRPPISPQPPPHTPEGYPPPPQQRHRLRRTYAAAQSTRQTARRRKSAGLHAGRRPKPAKLNNPQMKLSGDRQRAKPPEPSQPAHKLPPVKAAPPLPQSFAQKVANQRLPQVHPPRPAPMPLPPPPPRRLLPAPPPLTHGPARQQRTRMRRQRRRHTRPRQARRQQRRQRRRHMRLASVAVAVGTVVRLNRPRRLKRPARQHVGQRRLGHLRRHPARAPPLPLPPQQNRQKAELLA